MVVRVRDGGEGCHVICGNQTPYIGASITAMQGVCRLTMPAMHRCHSVSSACTCIFLTYHKLINVKKRCRQCHMGGPWLWAPTQTHLQHLQQSKTHSAVQGCFPEPQLDNNAYSSHVSCR